MVVLRGGVFCLIVFLFISQASANLLFYDPMDSDEQLPSGNQSYSDWYKDSHGNALNNTLAYSQEQARSGSGSYKFYLAPYTDAGDWASDCELQFRGLFNQSKPANFTPGKEYWMGFSIYVPSNQRWPEIDVHPEGGGHEWGLLWQFHGSGNSCDISGINPVLAAALSQNKNGYQKGVSGYGIRINGDTRQCLSDRNYEKKTTHSSAFERGRWHDYVLNFKFTAKPNGGGFFKVWQDGTLIVDDAGINMYNLVSGRGPYFVFGAYAHMTTGITVYFDELRVGDEKSSFKEVSPRGGVSPLQVNYHPPTATIVAPSEARNISVGDSIFFSGDAADSDGSIVSHHWSFGDSGIADDMSAEPGSKIFSIEGAFEIVYTVTDDDGETDSTTVTINVGSPEEPGVIDDLKIKPQDITADTKGLQALTNNGNIQIEPIGTEPQLPGYGSYGAQFNGLNQWFSIASADWHASAPWQTGKANGTAAIMFRTPSSYPSENIHLMNRWDQTGDDRMWGITLSSGDLSPFILIGTNSGSTNQLVKASKGLELDTIYTLVVNINNDTKYVRCRIYKERSLSENFSATYKGDMNLDGSSPFAIGRRADGPYKYFNNIIYWSKLYNITLTGAQMDSVAGIDNTAPSSGHGLVHEWGFES